MTGQITDAERAALPVARAALEGRASAYGIADSIVFALGSAGLLQTPATAAALEQLRKDRDAFADRVDTLTAVAKGNKRHVASLLTSLLATEKQVRALELERHSTNEELSKAVEALQAKDSGGDE